jgi:hypothetical protein
MRPRNFPERRNLRRKRALARLNCRGAYTPKAVAALNEESSALYERIVPSALLVVSRKVGGPGIIGRPMRTAKVPR